MFPSWPSVHPAHPDELPVPGNTDICVDGGIEAAINCKSFTVLKLALVYTVPA